MSMEDKTVLVTGANRGIGKALADEAHARGAKRVYAGTRQPWTHPDARVTPLVLDVTDPAQVQAAAGEVETLDVLINNAGVMLPDNPFDPAVLEHHRISASAGQEAFFEGHAHAFRVLGGVPTGKIRYDNLKAAVASVIGFSRHRVETDRWTAFRSHYGIEAFYCQPPTYPTTSTSSPNYA